MGLSLRLFAGENSSVTFSPGRGVLICRNVPHVGLVLSHLSNIVPHPGFELSHLSNICNTRCIITVTGGSL